MTRPAFHTDAGRYGSRGRRRPLYLCWCSRLLQNPHSHRNVPMEDVGKAAEIVMFASHLLCMVDAWQAAPQDRQMKRDPELERDNSGPSRPMKGKTSQISLVIRDRHVFLPFQIEMPLPS